MPRDTSTIRLDEGTPPLLVVHLGPEDADTQRLQQLEREFRELAESRAKGAVIEFADTTVVNSKCLSFAIVALRHIRSNGPVALAGPSQLTTICKALQLDRMMPVFSTTHEAIAAIRRDEPGGFESSGAPVPRPRTPPSGSQQASPETPDADEHTPGADGPARP